MSLQAHIRLRTASTVVAAASLVGLFAFCLAACGSPASSQTTSEAPALTGGGDLGVEIVPLPDGREVLCVGRYKVGLSCDWEAIQP